MFLEHVLSKRKGDRKVPFLYIKYIVWNTDIKNMKIIRNTNSIKYIFKYINQRDLSRISGDVLADELIDYIKNLKQLNKELYDMVADYAEKENHSILMMKLGLVEPYSSKGEKYLNEYKILNKPDEYENNLGKRILKNKN